MQNTAAVAFLMARLPIALSMLGHGLIRMPKLSGFSQWMVQSFQESPLPGWLVMPFSYVLPFLELVTGLLLLIGLFTRQALVLGTAVILCLIFGSCMIEEWQSVFIQMLYGAYFAVLFSLVQYNDYSVDNIVHRT